MGQLILITGGARSGKSDFAEQLARQLGGDDVLFVATAEAGDDEMRRRIAAHRQARPAAWQTLEAPRFVGKLLMEMLESRRVALVDCLTLLTSNVLLQLGEDAPIERIEQQALAEVDALVEISRAAAATIIVVTNEVGLGLVPPNKLGRIYRDLLGKANAQLAAYADAVYLLVSGIPIDVKQLAVQLPLE